MKALTVCLVARDVAPSQILEKVRVELQARGHSARALLGHGKPMDDFSVEAIQSLVFTSDVVLVGMSSSEKLSNEEIVAVQAAMDSDTPYGFVCDIFDCYKRPWFAPFREKASRLCVVAPDEIAEALAMFPNAEVVASGNPCWEDYFDPTMPRSEVRKLLGIPDADKVVLAVGGKDPVGNMIYGDTIRAAGQVADDFYPSCTVVLAPHPGDPVKPEYYECFAELSEVPSVKIAKPGVIPIRDLITASDVLVVLASNLGIEAACQRKPVIHYFHELYKKKVQQSGGWPWKPVGMQIAALSQTPRELRDDLARCLLIYPDSAMCARQKEVFPAVVEKGAAARKICDVLGALPTSSN